MILMKFINETLAVKVVDWSIVEQRPRPIFLLILILIRGRTNQDYDIPNLQPEIIALQCRRKSCGSVTKLKAFKTSLQIATPRIS